MPAEVIFLVGPIRSGKTTTLWQWTKGQPAIGGILQPDGPQGRSFLDILTGETERLELPLANEAVQSIGRFSFRQAAFAWANRRLIEAASSENELVIVDEIGPLELAGRGLANGLEAVLAKPTGPALLVVREHLLRDVQQQWKLDHAKCETQKCAGLSEASRTPA